MRWSKNKEFWENKLEEMFSLVSVVTLTNSVSCLGSDTETDHLVLYVEKYKLVFFLSNLFLFNKRRQTSRMLNVVAAIVVKFDLKL